MSEHHPPAADHHAPAAPAATATAHERVPLATLEKIKVSTDTPWATIATWYQTQLSTYDRRVIQHILTGDPDAPVNFARFDVRAFLRYVYLLAATGPSYFAHCMRQMHKKHFDPPHGSQKKGNVSGLVPIYLGVSEEHDATGIGKENIAVDFSRIAIDLLLADCPREQPAAVFKKSFWSILQQFPALKESAEKRCIVPTEIKEVLKKATPQVLTNLLGFLHFESPQFSHADQRAAMVWMDALKDLLAEQLAKMISQGPAPDVLKRVSILPVRVVIDPYAKITTNTIEVRRALEKALPEGTVAAAHATGALDTVKKAGKSLAPALHTLGALGQLYELLILPIQRMKAKKAEAAAAAGGTTPAAGHGAAHPPAAGHATAAAAADPHHPTAAAPPAGGHHEPEHH